MILPLKRYFDFSGRSRRKEYWSFLLFVIVALIAFMLLDTALGLGGTATGTSEFGDGRMSASFNLTGGLLTLIFGLAMLIPGLAVAVRRAHDQDKSGWLLLIPLYNIVMLFIEGTRGPNRFGADPKAADADARVFA